MAQQVETVINQQKRGNPSQSSILVSALGQSLVPKSEARLSLAICSHATSTLVVSLTPNDTSGVGMTIPPLSAPLLLSMAAHGPMVRGPWYVSGGTVPATYTFVETLNSAP